MASAEVVQGLDTDFPPVTMALYPARVKELTLQKDAEMNKTQ